MAKRKSGGKIIAALLILVLIIGGFGAYFYYRHWLQPNISHSGKVFIPSGATYQQVLDSISPFLENKQSFEWLAHQKKYSSRIRPGRYTVNKGENNNEVLNRLRIGAQDEIAIRIGNYSSIFELAGKLDPLLEADSESLVQAIVQADFARGYDTAVLIFFFFPDTYNFHWTISPEEFVHKMKDQFDQYWTPEKTAVAASKNMTPLQVTTLASIVQLESSKADEQPMVAGLYLNRLKIGMKLDADPTVIYALRKADGFKTKIHRVYYKNLLIESPYNTYRYKGLPPSPICMPNKSALEAVLHPAEHKYLYFVADAQRPGYHVYASTLQEQELNADKYRKWLNEHQVK
jgi:UPF0755 protein